MKQSTPYAAAVAAGLFAAAAATTALAQDPKPAAAPAAKPACASPKAPPKELVRKDLEPGTGRDVKFRTAVLVHYTGWLYDSCAADFKGAEFDSSRGRPTPFSFMVGAGKVIKGWDEGLIGMKETGAKRLLVIPPDKAYGDRALAGGKIPPNSTLVFEIEMLKFVFQPPDEEPAKK